MPVTPGTLPVQPGDILGVRGTSLVSRGILWASRTRGERDTAISHVGLIVDNALLPNALVVEAAGGSVREAQVRDWYGRDQGLVVMRPRNLTAAEIGLIVANLRSRIGERYGYGDIVLHLISRLTGWAWPRKLVTEKNPYCSIFIGAEFRRHGYSFGVQNPEPDDIYDFALQHPDKYELPLGPEPVRLWW